MQELEQELRTIRVALAQLGAAVQRLELKLAQVRPADLNAREATLRQPEPPPPAPAPPSPAPWVVDQEPATLRYGSTETAEPRGQTIPLPEEHEDLETRIGSHWLNRIGIVALLIGVSYFLKYAFENNWIGPAGRVLSGLGAGLAVVLWSEHFRRAGHLRFSWSLKAVGFGSMYLSLWAAFHMYSLIPAWLAFAGMTVVTGAIVYLAWTQDAQVLATFALAGGFATPVLVSTGQNHQLTLFSYITLLDAATLFLVRHKPWRRLLGEAFIGTAILSVGWYGQFYAPAAMAQTLAFGALFFAMFAAAPLLAAVENYAGRTLMLLAIVNPLFFFLQSIDIIPDHRHRWEGWLALAIGAVMLVTGRAIAERVEADEPTRARLAGLHTALAATFTLIAVPILLDDHWTTLALILVSGAMLYAGERGDEKVFRVAGLIGLGVGIFRMLVVDEWAPSMLLLNMRFATYLAAVGVLLGMHEGLRRRIAEGDAEKSRGAGELRILVSVAINVLLLTGLTLEVRDFFRRWMLGSATSDEERRRFAMIADFGYSALWSAYGAALMTIGFLRRARFERWQALLLIAVTVVKVFVYDVAELDEWMRVLSFMALGVVLLGISYAYQRDWLKLSEAEKAPQ